MKSLKKISLVYTLQLFAVILLLSNAGTSSVKEINQSVALSSLPAGHDKDSSFIGARNGLLKINTGKSR